MPVAKRMHLRRRIFGALAALPVIFGSIPATASSAVVLMYQRFGEQHASSTNIRLDQFDAHLEVIAERGLNVMPVPEILTALKAGRVLPDRTIGLSFDGGFRSFYTHAWPRLRDAGLPFTLFFATDTIDDGGDRHMTWEQIREIARDGATVGAQTASHRLMPLLGRDANDRDIARALRRLEEELGERPQVFAYPYGAMSGAARAAVQEAGLGAAFGQHSGVLHPGSPFHFLPRFPMNEVHGGAERFRLAADALPLAVVDVTPSEIFLGPDRNPPIMGFTVTGEALPYIDLLTCYTSGQGRVRMERIGRARVELRFDRAFRAGRPRLNCTMPARQGRWRWYGTQFLIPRR